MDRGATLSIIEFIDFEAGEDSGRGTEIQGSQRSRKTSGVVQPKDIVLYGDFDVESDKGVTEKVSEDQQELKEEDGKG
ncbi:MAG: hypothetical protein Q9228_004270 [Teloschistes exilis]